MKLSKEQALELVKVIDKHSTNSTALDNLQYDLEQFVLHGEPGADEETEDEKAQDNVVAEEDHSSEEDEEAGERKAEEGEPSEGDDGDDHPRQAEGLKANGSVDWIDLRELNPLKARVSKRKRAPAVTIEFVENNDGQPQLWINEEDMDRLIRNITYVRRAGKELHVYDAHGHRHIFYVTRFLKEWTQVVPLNRLLEVTLP